VLVQKCHKEIRVSIKYYRVCWVTGNTGFKKKIPCVFGADWKFKIASIDG
jgi:hypothetical protein